MWISSAKKRNAHSVKHPNLYLPSSLWSCDGSALLTCCPEHFVHWEWGQGFLVRLTHLIYFEERRKLELIVQMDRSPELFWPAEHLQPREGYLTARGSVTQPFTPGQRHLRRTVQMLNTETENMNVILWMFHSEIAPFQKMWWEVRECLGLSGLM